MAPTIPFWLGEAPGRSDELSAAVSRLRAEITARLRAGEPGEHRVGRALDRAAADVLLAGGALPVEVAAQLAAFADAVAHAEKAGVTPEVRHIANTAGALTVPECRLDLVRFGGALYGISTLPGGAPSWLRPAMTLRARLALVKRVPPGSGVSYGHRYVTDRETTLGLVPVGYADGVPRAATGLPLVSARGQRWPIAGTVCMDQFVVDFGDEPVTAGEEVVLFGPGDDGEPTAQEWGEALGTISYEIVTGIGNRVVRTYPGGSS